MTKVLVVDDSRFDRSLIRKALQFPGEQVEILELSSGEKAADTIETEHPCMTVLDIRMPRMDGFKVLTAIRGRETLKDHKVVMLSGSDRKVDRELADAIGANGYFVKPSSAKAYRDLAADLHSRYLPCSSAFGANTD